MRELIGNAKFAFRTADWHVVASEQEARQIGPRLLVRVITDEQTKQSAILFARDYYFWQPANSVRLPAFDVGQIKRSLGRRAITFPGPSSATQGSLPLEDIDRQYVYVDGCDYLTSEPAPTFHTATLGVDPEQCVDDLLFALRFADDASARSRRSCAPHLYAIALRACMVSEPPA